MQGACVHATDSGWVTSWKVRVRVSSGLACQLELFLCPSQGADRMDGGPEEGAGAAQHAETGRQAGREPTSCKGGACMPQTVRK